MPPFRARALLLLPLAALLFSGCGNDPNLEPVQEKRADGTPWRVRYGAMPDDPRSLDPQFAYDQMSHRLLEPVMDTLLEYHPFKTDPYEVMPALLEAMPERTKNSDGTEVYTCRLKRGIFFQDDACFPGKSGRELTVHDVEYGWKRMADPKVECPALSALQDYIEGLGAAYDAAKKSGTYDYAQPLKGFEVVDEQTFRIHLTKQYPQIIYWMAMQFTSPVPHEAVEYYDGREHPDGPHGEGVLRPAFRWHPVGTGAYQIAEYKPASRIRLVRNPKYHTVVFPSDGFPPDRADFLRQFAGQQLPLVDELQITIFREQTPIPILFKQGYLDTMGVSKDAFDRTVTTAGELTPMYRSRGVLLERDLDVSTFFISLNMQDPVLGPNKKLRQALSCAYDGQSYVDIFWNGVAPVAQQLMPPGIFGYDKDYRNPYGYNPSKAKQLLAEAGYPDGIDQKTGKQLVLNMEASATGSEERQMTEFVQKGFEQLGIKVNVVENTFAALLAKEDSGNFQILEGTGWGADYPDPENFYMLLNSRNFPPEGKNVSRYKNPEFDKLFDQMATMEDTPSRLAIVNQLRDLIGEDCPQIFTFHKAFYTTSQPWARRTSANMLLEGAFKYQQVDTALRSQLRRQWNRSPAWPPVVLALVIAAAIGYAIRLNRQRNV
ncbi:MAG: ABC transporter substrate-binding protein [Chthoniobacter sp.]